MGKYINLKLISKCEERLKMAWKSEKKSRQDILKLGKDTDAHVCRRLGGKEIDGRCVVVETGIGEDGDIHLKVLKDKDATDAG